MNFAFKERYQALFVRPKEEVGFTLFFLGYLAAGGAAGATSLTVSYPLEYTYTRMAADVGGQYKSLGDCISKTIKVDGVVGLYRGYGPSVAGIVVYRAGYFGLYDFSKTSLIPSLNLKGPLLVGAKFAIALTIDIFSAMLAYPLDTVRRSMMMQSGAKEKLFDSAWGCFNHIVKKDGVVGLYKGAGMNNIRAIGSAMVLIIYDELKVLLKIGKQGGHH